MADRLAIADVIHRYAYNIRHRCPAACEDLFTRDADYLMRSASPLTPEDYTQHRSLIGRDAIVGFLSGLAESDILVVPFISNILIEVREGEALSTCLMTNRIYPSGQGVTGEYFDHFRFEDGWKISRRIFLEYTSNT